MNGDQNWYRQLAALVLLSTSRAAVEFITNPSARDDAGDQLRDAFKQIDYDAVAKAITRAIDDLAESSKGRLSDTIDTLRDTSVDAVEAAQGKAESKLGGGKKKGKKMRFLFGILVGGLIAYFIFDEQRRDDLLDRLTGASGPIQSTPSFTPHTHNAPPPPVHHAPPPPGQHAAEHAPHAPVEPAKQTTGESGEKKVDK